MDGSLLAEMAGVLLLFADGSLPPPMDRSLLAEMAGYWPGVGCELAIGYGREFAGANGQELACENAATLKQQTKRLGETSGPLRHTLFCFGKC